MGNIIVHVIVVQSGCTALVLASLHGHTTVAKLLLGGGADIHHNVKVRWRGAWNLPVPECDTD